MLYGLLVGLLTEFPEKQKEVVAHVVQQRPDIVITKPIEEKQTQKEDLLKERDALWKQVIQRVSPQTYEEIIQQMFQTS